MNLSKEILLSMVVGIAMMFGVNSSASAQTTFEAQLSGSNEATPITSMATGSVTATLTGNELTVQGNFEGLSSDLATDIAGGAHIHTAMAGSNGGVLFPLTVSADADNRGGSFLASENTFELTAGQVDTLMARGFYVNIHSENYTGGELRGQLQPEADAYYRANLSGAFEVPSVRTMASGSVIFELVGDSLFVSGSFSNLGSSFNADVAGGSHLHIAPAGTNGSVAISLNADVAEDGLSGSYHASENRFELTSEQRTALMNREFYVNIHSTEYASGELRGQVVPAGATTFFAQLSGSAEQPSVATDAMGAAVLEVHEETLVVTGSFAGLESDFNSNVGSHLHLGHAGQNGGVEVTLSVDLDAEMRAGVYAAENNMYTLSTDQKAELFARNMYVNVHSVDIGSGEIRGQVLGDAAAYFHTNLAGIHEVQPIMSSASGAATVEYMSNGNIMLSGGFQGLSSAVATSIAGGGHLHIGSVAENGDVALPIEITLGESDTSGVFVASNNMFELESNQEDALFEEQMYVNIHSENYNGGELRGQVLLAANAAPGMTEITAPADGANLMLEGESSTMFEATWDAASDTNSNELAYIWQLSTDADFENIVVNANVGMETSFQTTFETLDGLLGDLGITVGGSATVYHRVVVTDGSEETASEPKTANIERGMVTSNETIDSNPAEFGLEQNYPNPFNPTTEITFSLAEAGQATLTVYNMLGQEVSVITNQRLNAGQHTVNFDASNLSSGIYLYRLTAENQTISKKMTLIK
ncbi:CHRD domain-containing protein [Gracilimonas mengyeensis]|uniref:Por secretion system C-terminal sorting domain-containing protein n=1 Tax=Gracilimonas mengyeensis TaxID=1302730 RepID=A0A521DP10_9BACT|nr:CHRD domain-containing protein [Gracilimonas mengyeensis]SMO72811.1 Por secretion system C-terminal sorting domain-containing protein [Gracilimonas mengyeensis]